MLGKLASLPNFVKGNLDLGQYTSVPAEVNENIYKHLQRSYGEKHPRIVITSRKRVRNKQRKQLVLRYSCVTAQHWKLYDLGRGHSKASEQDEKILGSM